MNAPAKLGTERSTLDEARECLRRGMAIVPILRGEKGPIIADWPDLRLTETDLPRCFGNGENIGAILGPPSDGLCDVDLDSPEALAVADFFLPQTAFVFGRASKPRSHRFFVCDPLPAPHKFSGPNDGCIIELRSTGQQTVIPPSVHETGELYEFVEQGEPSRVDGADLARRVRIVAAAALLARHWPERGRRNEAANAVAGMLLRAGWPEEQASIFIVAITTAASDEESRQRVRDVVSTATRLAAGRTATGAPTLAEIVGDEVVRRTREWLGLDAHPEFGDARPLTSEWPAPLDAHAFCGLAGKIVSLIEPHTEADPAAILIQFLALFGNAIGRKAHFQIEATRHFGNFFAVLVGTTSKARKGSSFSQVERVFEIVAPDWLGSRVHRGGLSSGEGVIWAVHDPVEKAERVSKRGESARYEVVISEPGVSDKRLLIFEPEFATVLRVIEREGNTLSAIIREAWDSGVLASLTKNSPARATGAHISIIGHITKQELLRYLTTTEAASGFANRFLFVCVHRSKFLPEGSVISPEKLAPIQQELAEAIRVASRIESMQRDEEARAIWFQVYPALSSGQPGLFGSITARAEAQVLRLSILYALLDGSAVIRCQHLLAALAVWEYCEASARFIFGDALGDPTADQILKALRESDSGLTRTEISGLFGRHRPAADIERALRSLSDLGLVRRGARQTEGRPIEVWVCIESAGAKKANYAK